MPLGLYTENSSIQQIYHLRTMVRTNDCFLNLILLLKLLGNPRIPSLLLEETSLW